MTRNLMFVLLIIHNVCLAQKATISGFIHNIETGEKLIGASVYNASDLKGTTSNIYGFYSLTLDIGEVNFQTSFVGFESFKETIHLTKDTVIHVFLNQSVLLNEVEILATPDKINETTKMSSISLSMEHLEKLPAIFGEKDIIKTLQLMPGIQSGGEASGGMYVRGGGADQNLILLDGVPVYNVNHLFGFFSVFNSDAISSAEIIKGGFPARYGGRSSSVLDIRMKEGNVKKLTGSATLGLISSKLTLEGPIIKDKTSFMLSGRRTYLDALVRPFNALRNRRLSKNFEEGKAKVKNNGGYYFYDLNAKVNHKFSDKQHLYLSAYTGKDQFYNKRNTEIEHDEIVRKQNQDFGLGWGNLTSALRYNHVISNKLFANVTTTFCRYDFNIGVDNQNTQKSDSVNQESRVAFDYRSNIYDWSGKIDFDYIPNTRHYFKAGLAETYHTFRPGINSFINKEEDISIDTAFNAPAVYAHEVHAYVEDDIKVNGRLKINLGLHHSSFIVKGKSYFNFEPRFAANYSLTDKLAFKAFYSRMVQYIHLLTNGGIGFPSDLWVPVTNKVKPIISDQWAMGLAKTWNKFELSWEVYYKTMQNLIEYKDGESFFSNGDDWQERIEFGRGEAYGTEVFVQKRVGQTSGWLGYTLAWSNRQFDNLNFGRVYPYKYDRRHDISLAIVHDFKKSFGKKNWKSNVGLVWVFGTGNAISLPSSSYLALEGSLEQNEFYTSEINNFEAKNDFREPNYHRLDLSFNITTTKGKTDRTWNFSFYNAYNRQNPFYLFIDEEDNQKVLKQYSLFPIIPSIAYSIKF